MNYYNENDKYAAEWLCNLIADGVIPDGKVDTRSIEDVRPADLTGFTQHHFFAGIGGWPLALALAGWPKDRPVMTGSCPCFPAGTLIITERGYLPIESVVVGDLVLTHKARWRAVTHVGSEQSELVKVKGQGHFGLICTPDHPFLSGDDEWTLASKMTGKRWRTVCSFPRSEIPTLTNESGVIFYRGKWRAAGNKNNKTVYLGLFNDKYSALEARKSALSSGLIDVRGADNIDTTSLAFARFLGYWVGDGWTSGNNVLICGAKTDGQLLQEIMQSAGMKCSLSAERTGARARIGSTALVNWLRSHFGAGALNKRIPAWVHGAPPDYRKAFIDGYWIADGCDENDGKVKSWSTISKSLAVGLRVLINQSGFSASIKRNAPKRLAVIEGRSVSEKPLFKVTSYESSRSFKFDKIHGIGLVRSVSECGSGKVFNLAVDEDNTYTADGIVVHNCQPFSQAGKGAGTNDERHLWPAFHHLISQFRPPIVFGEQVASKQALEWWDIVASDLEGSGYACAAADLPAASVQAPHLRSRLFWVATRGMRPYGTKTWAFRELSNPDLQRCNGQRIQSEPGQKGVETSGRSAADKLSNPNSGRCDGRQNGKGNEPNRGNAGRAKVGGEFGSMANARHESTRRAAMPDEAQGGRAFDQFAGCGNVGSLANNNVEVFRREKEPADYAGQEKDRSASDAGRRGEIDGADSSESFWSDADWVGCTDGNFRAAKPGTRVLDARVSGRVVVQRPGFEPHTYSARGAVKGFGNAIVPPLAAEFIRSLM